GKGTARVTTTNISALRLTLDGLENIIVDSQKLRAPQKVTGRGLSLRKNPNGWSLGDPEGPLRKRPGLTGPIDDAFMSAFLFVRPTGTPPTPEVGRWTQAELAHATKMWRDIFRGEPPVQDDRTVSQDDIATNNLILWGDVSSNQLLAKMLDKLPLKWTREQITFNGRSYDAAHHAPILIFP